MNINPSEVVDDDNNKHHHHRGYHQKFCRCKYNQKAYDYLLVKAIQLKQNDYNINIKLGLMKAAKSVLKYPLPILSEEEALLLNGVGKTIAKEIMKALRFGSCPTVGMNVDGGGGDDDDGNIASTMKYMNNRSCDDNQHSCIKDVTEVEENHSSRRHHQSLVPTTHSSTTHTLISHALTVEDSLYRNSSTSQLSMNNSTRKYIPEFGKVPWTILIALYRLGGNANKAQIETEVFGLNHTHDFIHADSYRDTRYSSLSILKKKGLIEEVSPTGHLWLTETGTGIAIEQHVIFLRRSTPIVSTVTTIASTTTTTTAAVPPPLPSSNSVTDDHNEDPSVGDTSSIDCDVIIGETDHDVDYNSNRMYARSNSISYNSSNGYHRGNNYNDDEDCYAKRDHPNAIAAWSDVGKGVQQSYLSVAIRRPTCEVVDLCSPPMSRNSHVNTDNITEDQKQYRSQSLAYNKHSLDPNRSPHTPLPVRPCRITTPSFVSIPLIAIEDDHRYDGGVMDDHRYDEGAMDDRHDGHYGGDASSYDEGAMDDHRYDEGAMDDRHDGHYGGDASSYDGGDASSYDDEVMICYPPLQEDVRCTVESYQTRLMRACRDENHNEDSDDAPRTVTAVREHSIAAGSDPTSRLIDYRARMDVMKEERNTEGVVDLTLDDSSADEAHGDDCDDGNDDDVDMMELHIGRDQSSNRHLCSIDRNPAAVSPSPSSTSTTTTTNASTTTTAVRSLFNHVISARPLHEECVHTTTTTHTNCIDIDIINPHDDRGMCNDKDAIIYDRDNVPVVTTGCHSSGSLFSMLASKHKQFLEARAGRQAAIPPSLSSSVVSASSVVGMERSMTSTAASSADKDEVQKENVHSNIVGVLNTSKARKRATATTTSAMTARNNKSHKDVQEQAATAAVDRTIIMNGSSAIVSSAIAAAGTTYIEGDQETRSGEGPVGRSYYQQKQLLPLSSLHACDWEVVLLIDKRERSNALIQGKMVANGVSSELCHLAVGDFLWVVRPAFVSSFSSNRKDPTTTTTSSSSSTTTTTTTTIVSPTAADSSSVDMVVPITCGQDRCEEKGSMSSTHNQNNHNSNHTNNNNHHDNHHDNGKSSSSNGLNNSHHYFVLDCVAERKTIADLASSISDGRYIEQKSRLKACNLRSTIYIIEGEHIVVPTQQRAITAASIKTAIVSINVIFLLSTIIIYQLSMYYTTILLLSYLSFSSLSTCCIRFDRWITT